MENIYDSFIKNFRSKETIVVAVSGGIDSMTLLHLLVRAKQKLNLTIVVAHVNHNVRKESDEEYEFVQKYCHDNKLVFEGTVIENYGDDNFHNEARNIRYNFFKKLTKEYKSKYLLTAHHADDLIETIMMRLVRGSSLKGYAGISSRIDMKTYYLVRPLMHISKDQIKLYAKQYKIKYREDQSNKKDKYTRNRFRNHLLPFLKSEDENVHEKFNKFSEMLFECNNYIDNQLKKNINKVYQNEIISAELFLQQDPFIQKKIIYNILENKYLDDLILITDRHVALIISLINSTKASGHIYLPNNIKIQKSYNNIYIGNEDATKFTYEIEIMDTVTLPKGKIIERILRTTKDGNDICRLDSNEIELPLHVRNKYEGDKMQVKGMVGSKKVSDIFINEKLEQHLRTNYPVVCDATGKIVWIPGIKKSKYCKEKHQICDIILKYY